MSGMKSFSAPRTVTMWLLCVVALAGCAGQATFIQVHRYPPFDGINRLMLVHQFDRVNVSMFSLNRGAFVKPVEEKLVAAMAERGVYLISVGNIASAATKAALVENKAQALLSFEMTGETVSSTRHHHYAEYRVRLVDFSNRLLWESHLQWIPGGNGVSLDARATTLVSEIMAILTKSGVIPSR